jgi:hypothetical protein
MPWPTISPNAGGGGIDEIDELVDGGLLPFELLLGVSASRRIIRSISPV